MFLTVKNPTAADQTVPQQPPYIDNPFAPEIFVTGFSGLSNLGGVIVLTLESVRHDHSRPQPTLERVVVGRIAFTTGAALELVAGMNHFLEQQGLSPSRALAGGATFQ
ncbi:hypothetical protein GCM10009087_46460 [Sphingomonas oligophenolica]|uniref:Uncharacterized protein n=1 Tax=Sphingomonas oligophenolica TaxID=301154 RepID=A0ABU9YCU7_9SPHN